MTAAERKAVLQAELARARDDVTPMAYTFIGFCEQAPAPPPEALEEAATEFAMKVRRVAVFAHLLAREDRS